MRVLNFTNRVDLQLDLEDLGYSERVATTVSKAVDMSKNGHIVCMEDNDIFEWEIDPATMIGCMYCDSPRHTFEVLPTLREEMEAFSNLINCKLTLEWGELGYTLRDESGTLSFTCVGQMGLLRTLTIMIVALHAVSEAQNG